MLRIMVDLTVYTISNLEKAQLMLVLARSKGNWGEKYDRTEHLRDFKISQNLVFYHTLKRVVCVGFEIPKKIYINHYNINVVDFFRIKRNN